ncbi:MAG: hypothetical protein Q4A74_07185 [Cardiobacteriaceae bacterium]|nr:hypothetical protein [Cardiobacteriaceae bacterium]
MQRSQLISIDPPPHDHPRLLATCEDATALADSYVGRAHTLPLPRIPAVLCSAHVQTLRVSLT